MCMFICVGGIFLQLQYSIFFVIIVFHSRLFSFRTTKMETFAAKLVSVSECENCSDADVNGIMINTKSNK